MGKKGKGPEAGAGGQPRGKPFKRSSGSSWPGEALKALGEGRCWRRVRAGKGGCQPPPHVACCQGHTLVPLPTEAWLQSLSRDPEAQGRGAWKPALGSGGGDRREEEPGEAEEDQEDEKADSLLSLWSGEDLAERPKPDQVTSTRGPANLARASGASQIRGTDGRSPDPFPGHCS